VQLSNPDQAIVEQLPKAEINVTPEKDKQQNPLLSVEYQEHRNGKGRPEERPFLVHMKYE
jgi:hypothetical protein